MSQDSPPKVGPYPFKPLRRIEFTRMSQTWLAVRLGAPQQSHVVLKIARRDQTENFRSNQAAITNEEQWLRKLQKTDNHPGLVQMLPIEVMGNRPIYSAKTHDPGEPWFIVVSYLAGGSLKEALARQPAVHPRVALQIVRQLADTLVFIHEAGCIHLDLKPDNIMFPQLVALDKESAPARPVLIDFGIAKPARERHYIGGVAAWMAPECLRAMDKHERIPILPSMDIYSLGLILNCLLTGKHPGEAETLPPVEAATLRKRTGLNARRSEQLAQSFNGLITMMTDDNAGRRPTAQQVGAQLDHIIEGLGAKKTRSRSRPVIGWAFAAASTVLVLLLALLILSELVPPPSENVSAANVEADTVAAEDEFASSVADAVAEAVANDENAGANAPAAGPIAAMTATASALTTTLNLGESDEISDPSAGASDEEANDEEVNDEEVNDEEAAENQVEEDEGDNSEGSDSEDNAASVTSDMKTSTVDGADTITTNSATSDTAEITAGDAVTGTTANGMTDTAVSTSTEMTATDEAITETATSVTELVTDGESMTTSVSLTATVTPTRDEDSEADVAGTPTPRPTATRISRPTPTATFTPLPTVPPAAPPSLPPSLPPAMSTPVPAADDPPPNRTVALVSPANGVDLQGRVEFTWLADFELGPNERYEAVFWRQDSNRDVTAYGLAAPSQSTSILVDLDAYRLQNGEFLMPQVSYVWSVRIVDEEGRTRQWLSDGHVFRYIGY